VKGKQKGGTDTQRGRKHPHTKWNGVLWGGKTPSGRAKRRKPTQKEEGAGPLKTPTGTWNDLKKFAHSGGEMKVKSGKEAFFGENVRKGAQIVKVTSRTIPAPKRAKAKRDVLKARGVQGDRRKFEKNEGHRLSEKCQKFKTAEGIFLCETCAKKNKKRHNQSAQSPLARV